MIIRKRFEQIAPRAQKSEGKDRFKAVFLLACGWSVGDAAEVLMMDEKTVRNHFQTWESGGVDALKQRL
ncbi:MAG: helix-turn-helix domain-containing protein [Planctomycetia bacterium]|nr:helix-turn-helix domain-containing protein [Planctomycetia bacterium]